jgi:myo-inositol-1(or 4)-monophosphatase
MSEALPSTLSPPMSPLAESPIALRDVAVEAAHAAGALLRERFLAGREPALRAKTSPTDLVSQADLAAERAIRQVLAMRRPADRVLGEEGGEVGGEGGPDGGTGLRWVVDPLDGTTNFLFGVPQWAVSIAVEDEHGMVAGAVLDPLRDELFAVERDGDATLDGAPLRGSGQSALGEALVGTGFAYDAGVRAHQGAVLAALLPRVRDVRRPGACSLDLAWTAAGRLDAFYERGVQAWDVAAGALLCARAGLAVRELFPMDGVPGGILVAPPGLVDEFAALITPR